MALTDIRSEHLAIPHADRDASVTLSSCKFQKICKDLTQFGDSVKIGVTRQSVSFSVIGSTGKGIIALASFNSINGNTQIEISCKEEVEMTFALRYLSFFGDSVKLELSNARRLLAFFGLPHGSGYWKYYLAPKVDDDESELGQQIEHIVLHKSENRSPWLIKAQVAIAGLY
jgi:proliferating cell nuclear antigen